MWVSRLRYVAMLGHPFVGAPSPRSDRCKKQDAFDPFATSARPRLWSSDDERSGLCAKDRYGVYTLNCNYIRVCMVSTGTARDRSDHQVARQF